ncbi:hypothetical protein HOD96_00575 [Candidatus Falkowbacteria bacterium]|nr:hypothetical protein [Candidatus Falkowbacteria bacterium]MBT4433268.1 hypothetical protein [Candidatus Falkowbacteria bacterium]
MARFECSKCRDITMLVPSLDVCPDCFGENFAEIAPTLSTLQKQKLITILRNQKGMAKYAEELLTDWWKEVNYQNSELELTDTQRMGHAMLNQHRG